MHGKVAHYARRTFAGMYAHHAFDHAATMSFYFFLGLIPLFVFAGSLVAEVIHSEGGVETLAQPLFRLMPPAAATLAVDELRAMEGTSATSMGTLSLVGFLILTSNGVHNLMDVFELVLKAPHRSWWKQRVLSLAWVAVSLLVFTIATWGVLSADKVLHGTDTVDVPGLAALAVRLRRVFEGTWNRLGVLAIFFGIASLALAAVYRVAVQHPREVKRRVWPGTFAAMFCWIAVSWLFGEYVKTIGEYAVYFGSLAAVAVLMIWLYLTSLAFLLGAELNAVLEGIRG